MRGSFATWTCCTGRSRRTGRPVGPWGPDSGRKKRGGAAPRRRVSAEDAWQRLEKLLAAGIETASKETSPLGDASQAGVVIGLVFQHVLPGYLAFHGDLLFHQTPARAFNAFFIGRAAEAVLAQGSPWEETDRIVRGAIRQLNDYLGYRPIAVLHNGRRVEPYDQERLRPVPILVAGAGVASGPYHDVVKLALEILGGDGSRSLAASVARFG